VHFLPSGMANLVDPDRGGGEDEDEVSILGLLCGNFGYSAARASKALADTTAWRTSQGLSATEEDTLLVRGPYECMPGSCCKRWNGTSCHA
jgi:hypothetical protein